MVRTVVALPTGWQLFCGTLKNPKVVSNNFIFTPIWGRFPFWLIFFRWVETTNHCCVLALKWRGWTIPFGFYQQKRPFWWAWGVTHFTFIWSKTHPTDPCDETLYAYIYICIYYIFIHLNDPCFDWKGPCFAGFFVPQNSVHSQVPGIHTIPSATWLTTISFLGNQIQSMLMLYPFCHD